MLFRFPLLALVLTGLVAFSSSAPAAESAEVAAKVDASLLAELPTDASRPMQKIGDEEFLRRVYLDIVGHIPSPEEVTAFALSPSQDKRAKVVEKLLADERFGENWGRYFRDVIMYRKTEDRAEIVSGALEDYLKTQFNANTSWAKVATDMVTASGDSLENGACALIIAQQGQPEEIVAEVSRIFLGVQIQCAQCHDHPTDRWKREQFHQLAAFFPRTASQLILMPDRREIKVVSQDFFMGRQPPMGNMRRRGTAEHYMSDLKNPTDKGKLMEPVFFATGDKLPLGTKDADRRGSLAKWITEKENPYFAKAFVNRLWGELNGEGFYEPVDDIGPDRDCSAPLTLEFLAKEFGKQNYDIKWLFRTITATSLYQAPSAPRRNPDQTPMQNNVAQRLRGDQLFDNLLNALGVSEPKGPAVGGAMAGNPLARRFGLRGQFNTAFGYDPSERRDEVAGSIPQALIFMNGPIINSGIRASGRTALAKMVSEIKDDSALVAELYLRVLAREPSSSELQTCLNYIKEVGNRNEAFEDVQWSLINSTEFLHRK